jgi:hypothetical protein
MREAVWRVLAEDGIHRDEPSTWTSRTADHLQRLKEHPAFRAVGGPSVLAAIDAILEGRAYETPKNWGALFIAFPTGDKRGIRRKRLAYRCEVHERAQPAGRSENVRALR